MADVKTLKTRIALKYDSYSAWTTAPGKDLVLLKGELGICYIGDTNPESNVVPTVLFKVGDGTKTFEKLPWASAKAADVYSWAKASEVKRDGKKLVFVGGGADGSNVEITFDYVTLDEVKNQITNDLDARITALEGNFDGENSVQGQINALDGRLDTAEGNITTLGNTKLDKSVYDAYIAGKTLSDDELKSYADGKASAAQSAAEATAAGALATAKSTLEAADSALGGRIDALVGDNGTIAAGDTATLEAAKADATSKANAAEAAAKSHAESKASAAQAAAEATAASALSGAVSTLNAKDAELVAEDARLAGLISDNADAIADEIKDREDAISGVTNAYTSAIATAKGEAIAAAKTETDTQVAGLRATVEANTKAINDNNTAVTAEIARVEGLVTTEASKRAEEDGKLDSRLQKVEAFFDGAAEDSEGLNDALDKLVDIQNYLNGEGSAADGLLGQVAANTEAIDALANEEDGRVTLAEEAIDALEGRATAVEGRADDLEAIVDGYGADGDDYTTVKAHVNAVSVRAEKGITDAATAQAAAEAADGKAVEAQNRVSTLENTTVPGVKAIAEDAQSRVANVEGVLNGTNNNGLVKDVEDLKTASAKHAEKTYVDTELAKYVKTEGYTEDKTATTNALNDRYTKGEADGKFATITAVEKNATDIGTNGAAIAENAGKIAENTTAIGAEETRALAQEAAIRGEFAAADTQISNRIDGIVNTTIPAAEAAAKKHADDQVAALKGKEVAENTAAISAVSGRVQTIENDYLKAADFFIIDCGNATLREGEPTAQ